jgi:lipopolysaccharide export system permease protein
MSNTHIINRYLIREVTMTLLGVGATLFLIFTSVQLVSLYGKAVGGGIQASLILQLLGLKSISSMMYILPLSLFVGILLAFSRMYKDHEMVVLAACGISLWTVLRSVISMSVLFALIVGSISLYFAPWAEARNEQLIKQHEKSENIEALSSGRFRELSRGEGVVYVQEFDKNSLKLKNVFVQLREKEKDSVVTSESGYKQTRKETGDNFLILENGQRLEGPLEDGSTAMITFKQHGIRLAEKPAKKFAVRQKAESTMSLIKKGSPWHMSEVQWRVSSALLCIVLAVLAIPLSKTSPRSGRYSKLALALLIYIIYSNLLNVSRAWMSKGIISEWVGLWWVHVLFLLLALSLYVHWKPILKRFWSGNN